jgi:peptidoglycan hydrolase-like protein with peptidoglycan-binding domain
MTYAPKSLQDLQKYLRAKTSLAWNALGIVGDKNHDGGYHCGDDRVSDGDYSVDEWVRDRRGLTDAASAIDIGNFSGLRRLSLWLVAQCEANAPDTRDIREIIYSPDGKTVKRWDRLNKRDGGDGSHRSHTHISYARDSEHRDKTALFKRYWNEVDQNEPLPQLPTRIPAPTPHYDFPLPNDHYFGPKDGPDSSVSGFHGRVFDGKPDHEWIRIFVRQLRKRGWNAREGGAYLTRYGNDGRYGPELEKLVRAFQRDQGLRVDGYIGPRTWKAAFENPVTA